MTRRSYNSPLDESRRLVGEGGAAAHAGDGACRRVRDRVSVSSAIFGGPLVGVQATHFFGYQSSDLPIEKIQPELRQKSAEALQRALGATIILPWIACLGFYSCLPYVYPADRDRALLRRKQDEMDAGQKGNSKA